MKCDWTVLGIRKRGDHTADKNMSVHRDKAALKQMDSKANPRGKMKTWSRFSLVGLLRALRDTYVKGCVTASSNAHLQNMARQAGICQIPDEVLSRSCSRNEDAFSKEFLDLSGKFCRQGSMQSGNKPVHTPQEPRDFSGNFGRQGSVQSGKQFIHITGYQGLTMADLQGYSSPSRRPSVDTVHELELFEDSKCSTAALEILFNSSSLHPTEVVRSPSSRRVAALDSYIAGAPGRHSLSRNASERATCRRSPLRFSRSDEQINLARPLTPELQTFKPSPSRFSTSDANESNPLRPLTPVLDTFEELRFPKSDVKGTPPRPLMPVMDTFGRKPRRVSTSDVFINNLARPLNPELLDTSGRSGRRSDDVLQWGKSFELYGSSSKSRGSEFRKASSRRSDGLRKVLSSRSTNSIFDDKLRKSNSRKVNKPNPYQEYDSRTLSHARAV